MKFARSALVAASLAVALTGCDRVVRVSTASTGGDANGASGTRSSSAQRGGIALDGTGRLVAFESTSTDLLPGGNAAGLFLRDLATGSVQRLGDGRSPDLTPDGRYVAYADVTPGRSEVVVLDRSRGSTEVVSVRPDGEPSGASNSNPSISDDGRFVTWESASEALVPGFLGTNVFVRDRLEGTTEVVSRALDGGQADQTSHTPVISGDGRFVAFSSWATDLTAGDTPTGYREVFRRDLLSNTTVKVSIDDAGVPISFAALHPSISDDGGVVTFDGPGTVYVRDLAATRTEDLGRGQLPTVSGDGRTVVFVTWVAVSPWDANGKLDVYARDRATGSTAQLSITADWQQRGGDSTINAAYVAPAISDDGFVTAFGTEVGLDPADRNGRFDVYVRAARRPVVSSVTPASVARGVSTELVVTGDGFLPGATAGVDRPGIPGVHVTRVRVISPVEIRIQVSVDADAPVGARDVIVSNTSAEPGRPATAFGACLACLKVS